jgi:hypothetical protein
VNNTEFLFWLQGYFELTNTDECVLDENRIQIIRDHITLVEKENAYSSKFITSLKAIFEFYDKVTEIVSPHHFLVALTDLIQSNLQSEFEKLTPHRDNPIDVVDLMEKVYPPSRPLDCAPYLPPGQIVVGDVPPGSAPGVWCGVKDSKVWSSPGGDLTCSSFDMNHFAKGGSDDQIKNNTDPNSPPGSC